MTTNLSFGSGTYNETLRGGTDYNINQQVTIPNPSGTSNVNLTFQLPLTIDNDFILSNPTEETPANQTLNFSIMNLTGNLVASGDATGQGNTALNGDILTNNGTITGSNADSVTINTKLLGGGGMSFLDYATENVNGLVGSGQSFNIALGELNVNNPSTFFGAVTLAPNPLGFVAPDAAFVDLVGLAATSYDFSHDVLTLWNGNKPVDRLNLTSSSGVNVYQINPNEKPELIGFAAAPAGVLVTNSSVGGLTALPQHTGV